VPTATPARAFYLDAAGEAAFTRLHPAPPGAPATGRAVLLVPPFGWEEVCSYRPRWAWARHLAERGIPVARLDLPGGGDSAGGPRDAGRLDVWTAAIDAAARRLAAETGPETRITLIGLGLGGLLGWRAAAAGGPVDDLVLWGASARGKSLVREIKAFSRLERSKLQELNPGRELPPEDEASITAAGWVLSAETIAALSAVDAGELPLPDGPGGRRILLLGRDGASPDARLAGAGRATGAAVATASGDGWGELMQEPGSSRAPWAAIAEIDAWLDAAPAGPAGPREGAADAPAAAADALVGGGAVREQPLQLDGVDGILAEPASAADGPPPFVLVLVNAGSVRRIGPNRMWVEIARRWAARGVPSVRLDLAGIGEAEGPESMLGEGERYYDDDIFARQIGAVLDHLQERHGASRFGPLGLCSGAYWALHAAADDERVDTAYALNTRVLVWDSALIADRDSRKLGYLTRASTYRRVVRGDIPLSRGVEIAKATVKTLWAKPRGHRADASPAADPVDALFDRLRDNGKQPYLLFTGGEPVHEELARSGRLAAQPERWPNLRIDELTEFRDIHTFQPVALQRRAHELIDAAIQHDLDRARAGAA
jgi:alpha-beta hydrolase superfamily lysophospholipase